MKYEALRVLAESNPFIASYFVALERGLLSLEDAMLRMIQAQHDALKERCPHLFTTSDTNELEAL